MGQPHPAIRDDSGDNVEANLDPSGTPFGQPRCSGPPDAGLLLMSDGLRRKTPAIGSARLDLTENDQAGPEGNEVDLDTTCSEVRLDGETVTTVELGSGFLTCSTEPGALMHQSKLGG